ncbi:sigma-70 family RNA polymerase sigma factor [Microbacterium profundi]
MQNHDHTAEGASADADLILRTRSGDADAFGELWQRHYPSGMSVARSITSSIDPDDLVQEAYARIYQAIIKGGGPNGSFRAYLFTSIRNTAAAWGRSRRETAMDELETVADPNSTDQAADEALDRSLTAQAFRGLPTRWQEVLWYIEIEQMKPAEVAPLLGMRAGAVSQLAFRAREGLREAWIQAHLRSAEPGSPCQWTIEHVGAYSRGNLSSRDQKRLEQHIEDCARCTIVVAEAKDVSNRLALVLLPLVLGISGAAGYTATLQAGGAPVVALAAMPSSVIEGGVVVGGSAGTSGAVGGLAGDGGTTAGGSAAGGSAAGGSTAGAVTGIGALVGAGSAALVVAGVVAATTIVPGLLDANPMTSMPSASEVGDSSISTELEPGSEMNDKFILEIEEEPEAPHTRDVDQTPQIKLPTVDNEPTAAPVAPSVPGGSGGDGDEGTTEPVKPPVGEEKPPVSPPGEGGEDPEPAVPTEKATVTGADWIDRDPPLNDNHTVTIYVSGVPGTSMEAAIVKDNKRGDSYIADIGDDGTGVFVLEATQDDLAAPNIVEFKYVTTDPGSQFSFSMTVAEIRELATGGTEDSEIPDPAEDQPAPAEPTAKAPAAQEQPSADEPVVEALAEETTSSSVVEEVAPDAVPVAADETPSADATAPLEDLARLTTPAEDAAPAE